MRLGLVLFVVLKHTAGFTQPGTCSGEIEVTVKVVSLPLQIYCQTRLQHVVYLWRWKALDNMASFFYGNGFQTIIDQKDYQTEISGDWGGVSDEDLFDKANETFTQLQNEGKPFLA